MTEYEAEQVENAVQDIKEYLTRIERVLTELTVLTRRIKERNETDE